VRRVGTEPPDLDQEVPVAGRQAGGGQRAGDQRPILAALGGDLQDDQLSSHMGKALLDAVHALLKSAAHVSPDTRRRNGRR
jgi:hypothetical protein